jgi:hypothetical protein
LKCQPNIKRLSCSCRKTTKVVDNENLGIYTNTGSDTQTCSKKNISSCYDCILDYTIFFFKFNTGTWLEVLTVKMYPKKKKYDKKVHQLITCHPFGKLSLCFTRIKCLKLLHWLNMHSLYHFTLVAGILLIWQLFLLS